MPSNLRDRTISGMLWTGGAVAGKVVLFFVITVILMKLLSPDEFGLTSMVYVFTGFSSILLNFGFGQAIIQNQEITQEDLSSVFWLNLGIGIFLTILIMLFAGTIADFYEESVLKKITIFISLGYLFNSLNIVHTALLQKELKFKAFGIIEVLSTLLAGIVAIVLALLNYGIWALVFQNILLAVFYTIIIWFYRSWRPSMVFKLDSIKKLLSFSVNMLGNQTINYWAMNFDKLIIGKMLGDTPLGIYRNSNSLVMRPINSLNGIIYKVLFPSFSTIQDKTEAIKRGYIQIIETLFYVITPGVITLYFFSDQIVQILFGEKWSDMSPLLVWFGLAALFLGLTMINGSIYMALGKANLLFKINLISRILLVLGILATINMGLKMISIAFMLSLLVSYLINFYFIKDLLKFSHTEYLSAFIKGSMPAALIILLGILLFYLPEYFTYSSLIFFGVGLLVIYMSLVAITKPYFYTVFKNMLSKTALNRGNLK